MQTRFINDPKTIRAIRYSYSATAFGEMLTAWIGEALCFAAFTEYLGRNTVLQELQKLFCEAHIEVTERTIDIFETQPETIILVGTSFQTDIWRALLRVESGSTITYSALACAAGHPRAVRAAASAVARNPISVIVPCHRVVPAAGGTGNYHGGAQIKKRLLEFEAENK